MTPSTPDYSGYELAQLYDLVRNVDRERFPERLAAIRRQIELRGGDPDNPEIVPFWVPRSEITPALKLVRWLVGLEYGIAFLCALTMVGVKIITNHASQLPGLFFAAQFVGVMCATGVIVMRAALNAVSKRATVETGWLSALGVAPFSAAFYMAMLYYFANLGSLLELIWLFVIPAGYYLPFVLLTFWIRYHFRSDDF